ncbi:uncharacterized protein EMH_0085230 [Eimeria mitis]|uniref:Uncharacterized protein n=1 Tax=Eimeria mitis TaxID=44415 RepID=U6KC02_9EIME|nr:uncharacterized protein EMH_0085230 [Eimeria mitis]CDJ33772.1 hypothetical protein EMH_0085230 [Eimeria mitis]
MELRTTTGFRLGVDARESGAPRVCSSSQRQCLNGDWSQQQQEEQQQKQQQQQQQQQRRQQQQQKLSLRFAHND